MDAEPSRAPESIPARLREPLPRAPGLLRRWLAKLANVGAFEVPELEGLPAEKQLVLLNTALRSKRLRRFHRNVSFSGTLLGASFLLVHKTFHPPLALFVSACIASALLSAYLIGKGRARAIREEAVQLLAHSGANRPERK